MRNWPRPTQRPSRASNQRSPFGIPGRDLRHLIPEHRSVISSSPCRRCYRRSMIRRGLLLRRGWRRCRTRPSPLRRRRMAFFTKGWTGGELMVRISGRSRWLMWSCRFIRSFCFLERSLLVFSSSEYSSLGGRDHLAVLPRYSLCYSRCFRCNGRFF